ncbi:MAG: SusC/RagA family TonB-linked outer membrane protein [Pseudarcicella sp.]|nr:SusC/RagA family TonB-linked outer membrane protein [Pseudarcicella sp.]MBP6409899.1 SusC/RagA family TonB-linked outer membrane protein [Pseudarcicella sp.]
MKKLLTVLIILAMCVKHSVSYAQQQKLKGKVKDESTGESLAGVSIRTKGLLKGTLTDKNGEFSLTLNADQKTLIISSVGYENKEVDIANNASEIEILLTSTTNLVDEVVVVGYGTARKKDATGSVTNVTSKDFNRGNVNNLGSLLQGKVAGVNITKQGGDPSRGASIQMRGPSTLNGSTEPFYVVDGVPGVSPDLVAPEDIETITVLKDAASTAIYGTRASNGVIMITTKRGQIGTRFTYNTFFTTENVTRKLDLATADDLRTLLKSQNKTFDAALPDKGVNTDWQDEILQTGGGQNHHLGLTGGSKDTKFNASFGYYNQKGVIKTSAYERYTGRLNIDHSFLENKIKVGATVATLFSDNNKINYNALRKSAIFLPTQNVYNPDGSFFQSTTQDYANPLALLKEETRLDESSKYNLSGRVAFEITKGITFENNAGFVFTNDISSGYKTLSHYDGTKGNGRAEKSNYTSTNKFVESFLNIDKNINKFNVKFLLGYSFQTEQRNNGISGVNTHFLNDINSYDGITTGNSPAGFDRLEGTRTLNDYKLISYFSRINGSYDNKYFISASFRNDGSSKFGPNNKWGFFPATSVAWKISNEDFLKNSTTISDLKLRLGYGVTGNQNVDPYTSLSSYRTGNVIFIDGLADKAIEFSRLANPDLKWEKTAVSNLGLDFELLKGKINGTVDLFYKKTTDMIYRYDVPNPPYAVDNIVANGGTMTNKGIEIAINVNAVKTKNIEWITGITFDTYKNNIESLSDGIFKKTEQLTGYIGGRGLTNVPVQVITPNKSIGTFRMVEYAGLDTSGKHSYYNLKGEKVLKADFKDAKIIEGVSALPSFTLGWTNTISYKNLSLNFLIRGVFGNKIYNAQAADLGRTNDAAKYNISKQAIEEKITGITAYSTQFLENGSFIRMDNATLSYDFKALKFVRNARFYVSANNLFTITNFKGLDPEVNFSGISPGIIGLNQNISNNTIEPIYYKTRAFTVGLNLTF